MDRLKLKVILGSTREGRQGQKVFDWAKSIIERNEVFDTEFIDLKDWHMPYYALSIHPRQGPADDIGKRWAAKIDEADAFIIITPEYNHSFPAVLKNALDYVYTPWNRKPVAFISYGGISGGTRVVEQLRCVVSELQMASLRDAVHIPFVNNAFDKNGKPTNESMMANLDLMLSQLEWWASTLKQGRLRAA